MRTDTPLEDDQEAAIYDTHGLKPIDAGRDFASLSPTVVSSLHMETKHTVSLP